MTDYAVVSIQPPVYTPFWNGERCPDNLMYRFTERSENIISIDGVHHPIILPKGFESDGGSIPRIAGYYRGLAVCGYFIHDQIYTTHQFDRKTCDEILRAILLWEGVSEVDVDVIYSAVRMWGSSHYVEV